MPSTIISEFKLIIELCIRSSIDSLEKLGLVFPKCRSKRKYGSVGFDYGTIVEEPDDDDDEEIDEIELKTAKGHEILSEQDKTTLDKLNKQRVWILINDGIFFDLILSLGRSRTWKR